MLIDDVTITIQGGYGGNGAATFKRNAMTAKGGPDGGNGGNGGSIYFQGINDILGLRQFQYKKEIIAEDGIKGAKQNLYGRNGKDTIVYVPLGTSITDLTTTDTWEILDETTKILLATGGKGGRGNNEFKTATNQSPTFAEKGEPGIKRQLRIQLRLIADIGFIGLPNAGKSSLLKALTNANPKIGDYAFTTLEPNLGVMDKIVLADIPGLIEGASAGKGLGTKFLKHVEKTKVLVHCIDSTTVDLLGTYTTVRNELNAHSESLTTKNEIILLTKTDLLAQGELPKKIQELQGLHKEIFTVSVYEPDAILTLKNTLQNFTEK